MQPVRSEVVSRNGVHTNRTVVALAARAPRCETTMELSSGDALGARASAHRHEHNYASVHHSSNFRAVVPGQQGVGCRDPLLLDVHSQSSGSDDLCQWRAG